MSYSIRTLTEADRDAALRVINDAARWYAEILPADEVPDPEMTSAQWRQESARMAWFGAESDEGELVGVLGLEYVDDVALLRHWYVSPAHQRRGVGALLREHLERQVTGVDRVIAGTYAANVIARRALEAADYYLSADSDDVLRRYYRIPDVRRMSSVTYERSLTNPPGVSPSTRAAEESGARQRVAFPVGFHRFHRSRFLNYQLNRLYSEGFLSFGTLEQIARRIRGFEDWRREFVAFAERLDAGRDPGIDAPSRIRPTADTGAAPMTDAPHAIPEPHTTGEAGGTDATRASDVTRGAGETRASKHTRHVSGAIPLGPDETRLAAAAFAYRAAEFLTSPTDPRKHEYYEQFIDRFDRAFAGTGVTRIWVDYQDGALPVLRLSPQQGQPSRGAILVHGGFDSLIEEFIAVLHAFADAGYDVYAFEGPGQGGALRRHGLKFDHDWEKPTSAVIDHFGLSGVTLLGFSMGGYWCLRAAAFEPRIDRVIVMASVLDWLEQLPAFLRRPVRAMAKRRRFMNASARLRMRLFPTLAHAISQCLMQIDGEEPVDAVDWLLAMRADHQHPERVTQDVLLMHGTKDRFQPLALHHAQRAALTNARSVTERLFTETEHAASHCQMGNLGLAVDTMIEWLTTDPT
jgi:pimeloyl-ACP methyl ester carboxylesterase/RimJ/RimL family protein N-acetyltransferase